MLKKIKKIFVFGFGFCFLVVLILAGYGYQKYSDWEFDKETERLKQELEKPYLEDTYGGKTPKETLEMFIAAVEKEDFDLASKYFVLSKQEEWRNKLKNGDKENLKKWTDLLRDVQDRGALWEGNFQMEVKKAQDELSLIIDFVKYPKGIWKIQEI